jgi:hypothetical protein
LLHRNANIGELKRKRQSYWKDTDEIIQPGEGETVQGEELIHKVRKIITLKNSRRGERKQERQFELKDMSQETKPGKLNQTGQEIVIRNVQTIPPAKKRRIEGEFLGKDQAIFTQDLTDIPLTPAETSNVPHEPRGHGLQPRPPLPIPGNFSTGAMADE